ncbi:MAG: hypothetical protein ACYDCO_18630 [Armatimonadota bacterium]
MKQRLCRIPVRIKALIGLVALLCVAAVFFLGKAAIDDGTTLGVWLQTTLDFAPPPAIPQPSQQLPHPNAFDDFVAASRAMVDMEHIKTDADPATQHRLMRQNARALALLRKGFSSPFRMPRDLTEDICLQHARHAVLFTRLLRMEHDLRSADGDWAGAAHCTLDAIQLSAQFLSAGQSDLADGGLILSSANLDNLWRDIPHLKAPDARAIAKRLMAITARQPSCAECMEEHLWLKVTLLYDTVEVKYADTTKEDEQDAREALRRTTQHYIRYVQASIANARLPYPKQQRMPRPPSDIRKLMDVTEVDFLSTSSLRFTEQRATANLLTAALGLHAYSLERGQYPDQVQALVPSYFASVPADPFAINAPLRYRRTGETYLLYSVGPDGRDDGGAAIAGGAIGSTDTGDLVAGGKR